MESKLHKTIQRIVAMPAAVATFIFVVLVSAGLPAAENESGREIWLISTRRAPLCGEPLCGKIDAEDARFDYWRLGADDRWGPADREAFLKADDPGVPTSFYIHGNRVGTCTALDQGLSIYRCLEQQADDRPFRMVIWSWPADRIRGRVRNDVRVKARRSDVQGYYLAVCLDRIRADVPVNMIGYSFGARVITVAMHIMAGGEVAGYKLPEKPAPRSAPVRAVLVAAALDYDWLLPDRRNGLALDRLDNVLITRNSCDRVLKWYPRMYRRGGPEALGYAGLACPGRLGAEREKIEMVSVRCSVGKGHSWSNYFRAPGLCNRLGWYALVEPREED
jgi:hypothetical protein